MFTMRQAALVRRGRCSREGRMGDRKGGGGTRRDGTCVDRFLRAMAGDAELLNFACGAKRFAEFDWSEGMYGSTIILHLSLYT
jgi:hypothetical protein